MSVMWRFILFLYNLFILVLAAIALAAAAGRPEIMAAINTALDTPANRMMVGAIAVVVLVLTIMLMFSLLRVESKPKSIVVTSSLNGQVSITVAAIKIIIMKAVKKVEGVRDIRSSVSSGADGLVIYLHMMINPEYSVPEMTRSIQAVVKEYLENIGGLQVAEVRVLVDDFGSTNKPVGM